MQVKFGRSEISEDEIDKLMQMMDTDGDGQISLEEFATFIMNQ